MIGKNEPPFPAKTPPPFSWKRFNKVNKAPAPSKNKLSARRRRAGSGASVTRHGHSTGTGTGHRAPAPPPLRCLLPPGAAAGDGNANCKPPWGC